MPPKAQALLGEQVATMYWRYRGYDSDPLGAVSSLSHGAIPVIPPRKKSQAAREYDTYRYHERALVECFTE